MNRLNIKRTFVALILGLVAVLTLQNCERDDICAATTSTTPRLMIEFYSNEENDQLENVPRLSVYGEGLIIDDEGNPIEPEVESDATLLFDENENAVELPLKVMPENQVSTVRYIFERNTNLRLDTDNTSTSNIDVIEIEYISKYEYVSRACGYKNVFNITDIDLNPDGDNDETWISNIEIIETVIENENTVHVYIYH